MTGAKYIIPLRKAYAEFAAVVDVAAGDQPELTRRQIATTHRHMLAIINQQNPIGPGGPQDYFDRAAQMVGAVVHLIHQSGGGDPDEALLIPDTCALYANPAFETWQFPGAVQRFTIVLVPSVVAEIDEHKDGHPSKKVREKAARIVRQIGEFRRRAQSEGRRLVDGVPLNKALKSRVAAWPREPNMSRAPGWLVASAADDRLLAAALEVGRDSAMSPIAVVTRDLNLHTKCELVRIGSLQPPEPLSAVPGSDTDAGGLS